MAASSFAYLLCSSINKHSENRFDSSRAHSSSTFKLPRLPTKDAFSQNIKKTSGRMLDALVDSMFKFVDQPMLPSQSNFLPVEEMAEAVEVSCTRGRIPFDFPEGVYLRNGPNHLFGGPKSALSIFGRSNDTWVEGEGMLHALYFVKKANGDWAISYKNGYVDSETFKREKQLNKPGFLPALEGDSWAILAAYLVNLVRFGTVNKHLCNTNIIDHAGKFYTITENHVPREFDISTLKSSRDWNINGAWDRPFTSHPKKAPGSGELVIMGVDAVKPYFVVGVISADGEKMLHKVDLELNRSILSHDIGVTQNYNILMDHPLTVDISRVFKGGVLMKYDKDGIARIGVMQRYGYADSIKWFEVETNCTLHILNCFEDGDEVVVRGCTSRMSIIPGPDWGHNKFDWFSRGFKIEDNSDASTESGYLFHHVHEWRLNMVTGEVKEKNLSGNDFSMDFPTLNDGFVGVKHKYGYTQVIDSIASSSSGMAKYGGLAKLYFEEQHSIEPTGIENFENIKIEYHKFPERTFCTGSAFVKENGGDLEDDGWIITFVHDEERNVSQVYVIDANKFENEPVAVITLPKRVPYGFHGLFVSQQPSAQKTENR